MLMNRKEKAEFDRADRLVDQAVQAIVARISNTAAKASTDNVAYSYVIERLIARLADELAVIIDNDACLEGDTTLRLSNALADFRDRPADR
jgi:hypothetical protein